MLGVPINRGRYTDPGVESYDKNVWTSEHVDMQSMPLIHESGNVVAISNR